MKFDVAKRDLESALRVVSHTVSMGGSDISSHYLFRRSGEKLEVLSYNGRVFSSCPVVATFEGDDTSFTIEAKRVHLLLDAVSDDSVLTVDGTGEVSANTRKGKNVFSSLDPELFPYWDQLLEGATNSATVPAERISAALSHAKSFVYSDEAKSPHLCVAEFRKGCVFSTDQMGASVVKVAGMESSEARIFGKDIGAILSFLSTFKTKPVKSADGAAKAEPVEVQIFECEKALFFRRGDGAIFGESKFSHRFPEVTVDWDDLSDEHWFELNKVEVADTIKFLAAGAKWDDIKVFIDLRPGSVVFSMKAANGKAISSEVSTKAQGSSSTETLPENGFPVANTYIMHLLSSVSGDTVRFGVTKKGKGGWIRVLDIRGEDSYLTTVAWLKVA